MCDIHGEFSDVWDVSIVRARKQYTCDDCDAPIPIGTRHQRIGSLYDGGWTTYRAHIECAELWDFISSVICGHPGYRMIGCLEDEIREAAIAGWSEDGERLDDPLMAVLQEIRDTYRAMAGGAP